MEDTMEEQKNRYFFVQSNSILLGMVDLYVKHQLRSEKNYEDEAPILPARQAESTF